MAYESGDVRAAERTLRLLRSDEWLAQHGSSKALARYEARMHHLRGELKEAAAGFRAFIHAATAGKKPEELQESLSREYYHLGRILVAAGRRREALEEWERGLACPAEFGNRCWRAKIEVARGVVSGRATRAARVRARTALRDDRTRRSRRRSS